MPRECPSLSELELELKRQDQSFQHVRDTLVALGDGIRLSIPERMMDELDAAFDSARRATSSESEVSSLHLRA